MKIKYLKLRDAKFFKNLFLREWNYGGEMIKKEIITPSKILWTVDFFGLVFFSKLLKISKFPVS